MFIAITDFGLKGMSLLSRIVFGLRSMDLMASLPALNIIPGLSVTLT